MTGLAMHPIARLLHDRSPYDGLDVDAYPPDLQGWGSDHPLLRQVIASCRPEIIVEVGSWKGASAIYMASVCKELGVQTQIICIDTWLGSPEHFLGKQAGWRESLMMRNGYPHLYFTFLSNVVRSGVADMITPLPSTSENAAYILREKGIRADVAYIDAAHEEQPAYRDFHDYWGLLTEDGVMVGDDYMSWEGVTKAAHRFATDVQRPLVGTWGKFVVARSERHEPRIMIAG